MSKTGELPWSNGIRGTQGVGVTLMLVGTDGLIYVGGGASMLVLNPDGSEVARLKLPGGTLSGIAQGPRGSVYASLSKGKLYSLKVPDQLHPK